MAKDTFKIQTTPTPARCAAAHYLYISNRLNGNKKYSNRGSTLTLEQLESFFLDNWKEYMELHDKWRKSRFQRKFCPTIDRIDNDLGYEYENIQLLPFGENVSKDMSKIITEWHKGQSKAKKETRAELMRRISKLGGAARAAKLTPQRRLEISRKANAAKPKKLMTNS